MAADRIVGARLTLRYAAEQAVAHSSGMLTFLVALSLTQAVPDVAVFSASRSGALSAEHAATLEQHTRNALATAGVSVQPADQTEASLGGRSALACEANVACFSLLGGLAGTPAVVRVEGSLVQHDFAVFAQAIATADGKVVAEESFVVNDATLDAELPGKLQSLAEKLKAALPSLKRPKAPTPPVQDVPLAAKITPKAEPKPELTAPPVVVQRNLTPVYLTAAGTIAAATLAITFTALGANAQSCLNGPAVGGHPSVCVPANQAAQVQQTASTDLTIGAMSGGAAIVLAAATTYLWTH